MNNNIITKAVIEEIFDHTSCNELRMKETGHRVTYTNEYDINIHEIISLLIQNTNHLCDNYAPDIIYNINTIREGINDNRINETFIVAIHTSGVDDIKRLIGCMNHERWSEDKYRRIYGIRVNHDNADNEVIVELRDIKSQINSYMRQMKPYITIND